MPVNHELASETYLRYRFCAERSHYAFLAKAAKCEDFFAGRQWAEADLNALKLQRRPALTINKVRSTIQTVQGEQIINRNEVVFRPSTGANANTADALTKVWLQIAQNNQLPWVRSQVFDDGVIRSRGFYDVRLDFSDSMLGEVKITAQNSKNVVIDPDAEEYDPDSWNDVFVTKWLTYQDIAILYDEADAELLRDRDVSTFPYMYDSIDRVRDRFAGHALQGSYYGIHDKDGVRRNVRVIERQHRVLAKQKHFVDNELGDMRPIPDGWDRNKIASVMEKAGPRISVISKQVKRIRWTVTADTVVLHDDYSPYKHFTIVPYFPQFRYGNTLGLVEDLLGPQEMLNKVSSQELHVVNTTANSGWKVKANSLKNMSIEELEASGATTGLVLELDEVTSAEKIQPNQTPSGLDRLSYKAEEHIKTISNVSDSMQGNDREDVAAKAIAYKQQRSSVNHSKAHDNLERTDWLLARNVLDIVQAFYTDPRIIHITNDDVTREPEQVGINQVDPSTGEITNDLTLGEYHIVISSAPSRANMEDSQFEQALGMRREGIQIPDAVLIENSRLMRRSEIVKQMNDAANSPEMQQRKELDMRQLQATVAKLEAEVGDKQADTQLKGARAQKDLAQAQEVAQGGQDGVELQKMQVELDMEQKRLDMEMRAKQQELEFKQRELEMKMRLQQEAHAQDMRIKQQQAEQAAAAQRDQQVSDRAAALRDGEGSSSTD